MININLRLFSTDHYQVMSYYNIWFKISYKRFYFKKDQHTYEEITIK